MATERVARRQYGHVSSHTMNLLEQYITREKNDKIKIWSINTTLANIIGQSRSEDLERQISNWEMYESFWSKYGLILNKPSRLINIYFLISLKSIGRLFCLPDAQPGPTLKLEQFENQFDSYWIYERELNYDPNFNFKIIDKGFRTYIHSPVVEVKNFTQLTHLLHSGFGDESCLENYFVIKDDKLSDLVEFLNSEEMPKLNDLLNIVEFLCMDYKGEDQGYGSLFEIYSSMFYSDLIDSIISGFEEFKNKFDGILLNSVSLKEVEFKTLELMKEYGC